MMTDLDRKSRTRGAILEAAQAALLNYGLRRSSLDDIAKTAGVSRTAVYHHFTNKEQLFTAIVEEMYNACVRAAETIAACDLPIADKIAGVLFAKLGYFHTLARDWRHGAELTAEESQTFARSARLARDAILKIITALIAKDPAITRRMAGAGLSPAQAAEVIHGAAAGQSKVRRNLSLETLEARLIAVVRLCLDAQVERDGGA
jgi:AcrR family transcriptional regulator